MPCLVPAGTLPSSLVYVTVGMFALKTDKTVSNRVIFMSIKFMRKYIFAHLFSVRNMTSLSRHEQVYLMRLRFER